MLNQLSVVDFHGNPVSFTSNYRLYMVYHVSSLKAVDGTVVVREPLELVCTCVVYASRAHQRLLRLVIGWPVD